MEKSVIELFFSFVCGGAFVVVAAVVIGFYLAQSAAISWWNR